MSLQCVTSAPEGCASAPNFVRTRIRHPFLLRPQQGCGNIGQASGDCRNGRESRFITSPEGTIAQR